MERPHEATNMTADKTHNPTGNIHAVVWIDHHEARIFRFDSEVSQATHHVIQDDVSPQHLHHKANSIGSGHVPVNHVYLEKVAANISDAKAILIVGPSSAKREFYRHLERRHHELLDLVVGVETLDHPGDGPLLAHAAQSFRNAARMGRPYAPTRD
jgi:stalled ribosome rescue protein Dom34